MSDGPPARRPFCYEGEQRATMIAISISHEACEAIKATLPKGADSWPAQRTAGAMCGYGSIASLSTGWRRCAGGARATTT
jgi:hypothetical protein